MAKSKTGEARKKIEITTVTTVTFDDRTVSNTGVGSGYTVEDDPEPETDPGGKPNNYGVEGGETDKTDKETNKAQEADPKPQSDQGGKGNHYGLEPQ